jgi:hypothetical protein
MPNSHYKAIPAIIDQIRSCTPTSVLDAGAGWGNWGLLIREYVDGWENKANLLDKITWRIRVEGIEGDPSYHSCLHDAFYNRMYWELIQNVLPLLGCYDVVLLLDVLEHVNRTEAPGLIKGLLQKAKKRLIITVPGKLVKQVVPGHPLETHQSAWSIEDFKKLGAQKVTSIPIRRGVFPRSKLMALWDV